MIRTSVRQSSRPPSISEHAPSADRLLRRGVTTYILALLLIAAFSIACHFVTDSIVRRQEMTARVVNLTGRQRMLSQRIARLSIERTLHTPFRPGPETEAALAQAIRAFEQGRQSIQTMRNSPGMNPLNDPAVKAVYTSAPWNLDAQMASFQEHIHSLQSRPTGMVNITDPDLVAIEAAVNDPLISALNAAVETVEQSSEASVQHLRRVLATLTGSMLLILLLEALLLYRPLFRQLRQATRELVHVGRTDPLTGCLNRRAFLQESGPVIRLARLTHQPLCVIMMDLDRFKAVNDQYGHAAGDAVINAVVASTLQEIRSEDLLCRMGGEEFAVLLPGNTLDQAVAVADRLRAAVESTVVQLVPPELDLKLSVTVSIGVTRLRLQDENIFPMLGRADRALYRAKENGRNRVECEWEDVVPHTSQGGGSQRSRV